MKFLTLIQMKANLLTFDHEIIVIISSGRSLCFCLFIRNHRSHMFFVSIPIITKMFFYVRNRNTEFLDIYDKGHVPYSSKLKLKGLNYIEIEMQRIMHLRLYSIRFAIPTLYIYLIMYTELYYTLYYNIILYPSRGRMLTYKYINKHVL